MGFIQKLAERRIVKKVGTRESASENYQIFEVSTLPDFSYGFHIPEYYRHAV